MKIPLVNRLVVEKLLSSRRVPYFALSPVWLEPNKWRVFIPSPSEDINQTIQIVLALHESIVIEEIEVFKTQTGDGWLHEVIFYFTSVPEQPS